MEDNQVMGEKQVIEEVTEFPVKKVQKGWGKAILYTVGLLALAFAIQLIIGVGAGIILVVKTLLENGGHMERLMTDYMTQFAESGIINAASAIASLIAAVVFGLWYKLQYARHYKAEQFKQTLHSAFTLNRVAFIVLTAVTCYVLACNVMIILDYVGSSALDQYLEMAQLVFDDGILTFIMTVIFAPIGEECLVRGLIQRRLEKYFPMLAVLLIESICFGILHGNIVQGIYVLPIGMMAGYLSYKYRSVLPAILLHMIYNSMSYIIDLIPEAITDQNLIWHIAAVILVMVMCIIMFGNPEHKEEHVNVSEG